MTMTAVKRRASILWASRISMGITRAAVHSKGRPLPKHPFLSAPPAPHLFLYVVVVRSPKFSAVLGGLRLKYLLLRPLPPHWLMVSSRNSATAQPGSMHDPMHDASEASNVSSSYPLGQQ